jgi:hypothetical protein
MGMYTMAKTAIKTVKQEKSLSNYDKFGIVSSVIGLIADILALAIFGLSFINSTSEETPISTILWLGIMSIIPLLYSWGFLAWLLNSRYGKLIISVVLTGIIFLPLYIFWGAIVVAEGVLVFYRDMYRFAYYTLPLDITSEGRAVGALIAVGFQLVAGLLISLALMLWNRLIAQETTSKSS